MGLVWIHDKHTGIYSYVGQCFGPGWVVHIFKQINHNWFYDSRRRSFFFSFFFLPPQNIGNQSRATLSCWWLPVILFDLCSFFPLLWNVAQNGVLLTQIFIKKIISLVELNLNGWRCEKHFSEQKLANWQTCMAKKTLFFFIFISFIKLCHSWSWKVSRPAG